MRKILNNLNKYAKKLNLLYVEDNDSVRKSTSLMLQRSFENVVESFDGVDGLEKYTRFKNIIDLVITDINMPNMNGIDMISEIKKINPDQQVLVVSAHGERDYFTRMIKLGVDGYLLKPTVTEQFIETISASVEKIRLKKENVEYQKILERKNSELNKSLISFGKNVIASNTDTEGNITYASKAFCDISGYKEEDLLGKPHNIVHHPDMPKETFEDMWKSIENNRIWEGEIKNRNKSGGTYWDRTTMLPEYNYANELVGYSSIRHDITAQKAKEEFFSNMSHELRTPLNAITGFLGVLKRQTCNLEHLEYLNHIGSSSQQLLTLINDILDLSKIKTSEFTIDPYEFNAYDELKEQSYQLSGMLSSKDIAFVLNIHPILSGVFMGDWTRINQIILNLFSNAIKFTPEGGTITIDADYIDNEFIVIVKDTGIGMSPEVQDKVFKPFVQADGSTTRKYGGTGLGLSITQKLIELMNGKLTLESEEGEGTIFRVSIPMEKLSSKIDKEESVDMDYISDRTLSGKVLIVEDNKTNQIIIELLLREVGVECDIVDDGTEALESYNPDVHQLILMDENMPNMNGITAMKHIREKYQESCGPIIALTANVMKGDRERFLMEGMDEYLPKPINERELYGILKKYLNIETSSI